MGIARTATTPQFPRSLAWLSAALLIGAGAFVTAAKAEEGVTKTHAISTFGEFKYPANFPHFDYVNPDAPIGGTMRFVGTGAVTTFDSLNPFILKGVPAQGLGLMYDTLLAGSADEPDTAYAFVAESFEYPEDRSWVIFNINPDATFSDGEPIKASDLVFSYEILMEEGHPRYQITYQDIEAVEALDTHRVKFTFREDAPKREVIQLAGGLSIIPEHYYQDVAFGETTLTPPVGSGGYLVRDASPGRSITYCRNPDYWGWEHPINVGQNNFECYTYEFFADRTVAFEAFKSGAYQFHESFFSKEWATGYEFPAVTERGWVAEDGFLGYPPADEDYWVVKTSAEDNRPSGTQGFWINMRRDKLKDPRVREALGMMFNFEWSNKALFYGIYDRVDSFWENTQTMQAMGVPEGEELAVLEEFRDQLPEGVFTEEPFSPVVNNEDRISRSVTRRAGQLLDEAGWTLQDGVRKNADGETLTIDVVDDSPAFERIINPYIENLRQLGIDARLVFVDPAQMQQRQKDFDYDLLPGRLVMSLTPGLELRNIFSSAAAESADSANYSGVADPVVDALIEKIVEAEDRPTMEARVRALSALRAHPRGIVGERAADGGRHAPASQRQPQLRSGGI